MISEPDLFTIRYSDTRAIARESIAPIASDLRSKVLAFILGQPNGATCCEVESGLGMSHQTASARIKELMDLGLITDSGERRKTSSGRPARVMKGA